MKTTISLDKDYQIDIPSGEYKNLVELVKKIGLKKQFDDYVGGGDRTFEEYLDDYSDRPISFLVMCDYFDNEKKWSCSKKKDWRNCKVVIKK